MKWRFLVAALTSRPGRVWPCRCFWFICWGFLRLSSCLDVGRTAILQRSSPYETATTSSAGSLHIKQYEMGLIKSWSRSVSACERSIFEECQIVWWMCGEEKNQAETCHQVISSICSALLFYMALEMLCVFSCSLICSHELNEQLHRENCPKWHFENVDAGCWWSSRSLDYYFGLTRKDFINFISHLSTFVCDNSKLTHSSWKDPLLSYFSHLSHWNIKWFQNLSNEVRQV